MELFEKGLNATDIDALIFVTQSPDYFLPATSCLLQDSLGLSKSCLTFDINQGCSGFVYGLGVSTALISAGFVNKVLLLCGDTYTRYIRQDDRTCRPIFSDGAAAIVVSRSRQSMIGPFVFGSDGLGGENLIVKSGAFREKSLQPNISMPEILMNGPKVFLFTLSAVPKLVDTLLEEAGIALGDIDLFVFHQASAIVIESIVRKLELPANKVYSNLAERGNMVSASIPIALSDAARSGRLRAGDIVLLCGFGVGYSWGATLICWDPD
jgi:3-oxoacyl-[acyl-carrier-protein] synthase-3